MLMEDASIFSEEAWRYSLASEDAPLELAGTVYTEMKGAYTINTARGSTFLKHCSRAVCRATPLAETRSTSRR